ncbi:hypothetical protein LTR82_015718 [Friedmanniomyces endolithicus]|uniref:Chromo domain-containing protein n=1 Tax=Friedmanniomyces endolithicus TaxID=329885 RepID=A0AAN6J669_9PEZI|nr:hypothetical protein LTR82_015718 [Friedmanniomyces endolithicus]
MSKNASGSRKPFIEEVDEDSVASDTTQDSEQEDDNYGVDEILAEDRDSEDAGGGIRYLLKWTGYPLMRSTWEPAAHIHTDLVIKQWEEQKRRIRLGEVEAFNLEDWHAKKNRLGEEKLERVGRRKAKRRRRGLVVSSDEEYQDDGADGGRSPNRKRLPRLDSDDEEVIDAGQSVKRQRRVKAAPVKRKGIARKVSSVRKQVDTSSEDEAEAAVPNTQDSDLNSLFEEVSQPIYPDIELSTKPRPVPNSKAATPVRAPVRDPPTSAPKPSILHAQQGSRAENAVGTATRTKDQNVFAHFPDTDRKRRQRTRVSGETRKDSADPKFTKLSIQNRYQNYGKNEPAPDINALSMIDPKTGKIEAPKITSASAAIPDVYGRRRSPPRTGRQRSLTPPPPPPPPPPADHQLSGSDPTIGPSGRKRTKECWDWRYATCRATAETCNYAHYNVDRNDTLPKFVPENPSIDSQTAGDIANATAEATTTPIIEAPQTMESTADRTVRFQLPQSEAPPAVIYNHRNSQITPATIEVRCGSAAAPDNVKVVAADLHVSGASMFERLFYPIRKGVYLMPDSMITAKDVQTYMAGLLQESAQWPAGSMVPAEASRLEADAVVECCKLHASGLVAMQDKYTLLLYPAYDDEWRFVERPDAPMVPNAPLRFLFMPPMKGRSVKRVTATPSPLQRAPVTAIVAKDILGIDARKLLIEKDGKPPDTSVFLAWPQEHDAELEILVKTFQELSCKVYHSGTPGAWQNFRRRYYKSCLILVHPDTPLWEIPRLHSILLNGGVRVFSIGLQRTASPSLYGCERLFPIGKVTFITDDVFVNHPEQASQIIQLFLDTNKAKPPGGENDKIAARPGVKDWLRHLATERTRDGNDKRWLRLYYDICQLCPPQDEDLYDLPNPSPTSHLVSLPPREMPSSVGLWERDPEAATDAMVEWFAGWSVLNASQYRKFLVCFESEKATMVMDENGQAMYRVVADPRGWAKSWQHIDVQRPEQLGKKLVGNGK